MRIVISRTDSIGDVVLTLPMAGAIKMALPEAEVSFLGRSYTEAVIRKSKYVDHFLNWDEIQLEPGLLKCDVIIHVFPDKEIAKVAKKNGIKTRIGTSHRLFHIPTCNKLVNLGRKNSDQHEAILNLKLLDPLNIKQRSELADIPELYGWSFDQNQPNDLVQADKFNLILHPKSKGSAKEWKLSNYTKLSSELDPAKYNIIITGTDEDGQLIRNQQPDLLEIPHVHDATGRFTLPEFITFIENCDGICAASTGPLHIGAAAGIHALGLYPSTRPMHAGRWAPIGLQASYLSEAGEGQGEQLSIEVPEVAAVIKAWEKVGL